MSNADAYVWITLAELNTQHGKMNYAFSFRVKCSGGVNGMDGKA